jgi:hypothetical protein
LVTEPTVAAPDSGAVAPADTGTTDTAPADTSAAGTSAAETPADGALATGGTGIDGCGQPTPDDVAGTFVSDIQYAGADTYGQCLFGDGVTAGQVQEIKDKDFSILNEVADTATNTYTFTADDGTKAAISLTLEPNGKYYVTDVAFS